MTIKKYLGKTRDEALELARQELGPDIVVMHVKEIRGQGFRGLFQGSSFEVTVGVEDDSPTPSYLDVVASAKNTQAEGVSRFNAVADDKVVIPSPQPPKEKEVRAEFRPLGELERVSVDEEESIRSAFREVSEVVAQAKASGKLIRQASSTYDRHASIIKPNDPVLKNEYTRDSKPRADRAAKEYRASVKDREKEPVRSEEKRDIPATVQQTTVQPAAIQQETASGSRANSSIIKAVYTMLLEHEVDEHYINQVMGDLDLTSMSDISIETALGMIYQKLVLKFGRPKTITISEKKPKIVFFVGPTGVGKTTTIAKLASHFRLDQKKKVALFTADTYRIAAMQQLSVYGELMQIDVVVLYEADDINEKIAEKYSKFDLILVDTTGFSHHDQEQKESINALVHSPDQRYDTQIYLVLSATTKYRDLKEIVDVYHSFTDFDLIFTKLDETEAHGNILNIKLYTGAPLSYVTTGQNVPSDIEVIDTQKMVHGLLGGR